MENLNTQDQERENINKKHFLLGVIISFIALIVCSTVVYYLILLTFGPGIYQITYSYPFFLAFSMSLPFFVVNSILFSRFRRNLSKRKGVKWGYLLATLPFVFVFFLNLNVVERIDEFDISRKALETKNEDLCFSIEGDDDSSKFQRSWCLHSVAVEKNDITICEKIVDDLFWREDCFDTVALRSEDDQKLYKNEEYGFSFRYPKEWGEPKLSLLSTRVRGAFTNGSISQYDNGFTFGEGVYYNQDIGRASTATEMIDAIKNLPYVSELTQENVKVGGKDAIRVEYTYKDTGSTVTEIYVPIDASGNIFRASSDTEIIGINTFNKIINSLQFVK